MKLKFSKYLITVLLLLTFSLSYAYDYTINDSAYTISNSSKIKIDLFVKKKVTSVIIANKYIKALNKINPISLKNPDTKNIYYYLKYKLYIYVDENTPVAPVIPKTVVQKPVNTPITLPGITISDITRLDTTNKLSTDKKNYIETLKRNVKEYVEVDNNMEFVEYGSFYKVYIKSFYNIKFENPVEGYINLIKDLNKQILIKKGSEFWLSTGGYSIEKKYSIKDLSEKVQFSASGTGYLFFDIKDEDYYMYILENLKYYEIEKNGTYISDLPDVKKIEDTLLLQQNSKYMLVPFGYTKVKLFKTSLLSNVENPLFVLKNIGIDYYLNKKTDIENTLINIQDTTKELIKNVNNDQEKIKIIYSWITKNINYDSNTEKYLLGKINLETYNTNNKDKVHSGLETFNNKSGVCDGYSKLTLYMLNFAGIKDAEMEIGTTPKLVKVDFGHSWLKIGEKYYDPTFDISSKGDVSKFKRFGLTGTEMHKTHIPSQ